MALTIDRSRRTGTVAVVGGLLLFFSVAADFIYPARAADAASREPLLSATYVVAWVIGWVAIAAAVVGLRRMLRAAGSSSRAAAIGTSLSFAGAAVLATFGLLGLAAVVAGVSFEIAFVLYLAALPLVVSGQLLLAVGLRLAGAIGRWWLFLALGAAGAAVAAIADIDPVHDLGLFTFAAAWVVVGLGLLLAGAPRRWRNVAETAAVQVRRS
ncbi:MAG: hypothetical protein ACRDGJ_03940 [Candidatus Limnocylindria bacterium]